MAAMNIAIILAITADPVSPRILYIGSMRRNMPQVKAKIIMTATNVTTIPDVCRISMVVVIAPGPTRRGQAIGTAPTLLGETIDSLSFKPPNSRMLIARTRSKMPPAIMKLCNEIPNRFNTCCPASANTRRRAKATQVAV